VPPFDIAAPDYRWLFLATLIATEKFTPMFIKPPKRGFDE
jgi:hypothetical protein